MGLRNLLLPLLIFLIPSTSIAKMVNIKDPTMAVETYIELEIPDSEIDFTKTYKNIKGFTDGFIKYVIYENEKGIFYKVIFWCNFNGKIEPVLLEKSCRSKSKEDLSKIYKGWIYNKNKINKALISDIIELNYKLFSINSLLLKGK